MPITGPLRPGTDVRRLSSVGLSPAQQRSRRLQLHSLLRQYRAGPADMRRGGSVFSAGPHDESVCPSDCARRALIQRRGVVGISLRAIARPPARSPRRRAGPGPVGSGPCSARLD